MRRGQSMTLGVGRGKSAIPAVFDRRLLNSTEFGGHRPPLSKLEAICAILWGFAPRLCGKALPFRPNLVPFPLIRAAGRRGLPAARMSYKWLLPRKGGA